MFQRRALITSPGRRVGGLVFGLSLVGLGFSFAQSRPGGRPMPSPMPPMERGPARIMPERPGPVAPSGLRTPSQASFPSPSAPVRPASSQIITPRPMARCTTMPNAAFWQHRDIMAEIQWMSRRGMIPVIPVADDAVTLQGASWYPAGWIAYGFRVPAGESLKVSLDHPNRGWFRLMMVNKWGRLEEGMLQNVVHTYEPVVTYKNPGKDNRAVYVIVDDPGWMSTEGNPFTVTVTRSWDPAKRKIEDAPVVTGIWAQKKEEPKPAEAPKEAPAEAQPKG